MIGRETEAPTPKKSGRRKGDGNARRISLFRQAANELCWFTKSFASLLQSGAGILTEIRRDLQKIFWGKLTWLEIEKIKRDAEAHRVKQEAAERRAIFEKWQAEERERLQRWAEEDKRQAAKLISAQRHIQFGKWTNFTKAANQLMPLRRVPALPGLADTLDWLNLWQPGGTELADDLSQTPANNDLSPRL